MEATQNPLLDWAPATADPAIIQQSVARRPIRRKSADSFRRESAAEAIQSLDRDGFELFGLTRGQFSLTDMIVAILAKTGPAKLSISTWTAARADVETMLDLMRSGQVTGCRWLVDQTFVRRAPELAAAIRERFGHDAIRVTRTHAKFVLLESERWRVALRSSMNLNQNPRLESFQVGHDPELCDFLGAAMDDFWARQSAGVAAEVAAGSRWMKANEQ